MKRLGMILLCALGVLAISFVMGYRPYCGTVENRGEPVCGLYRMIYG
jgi:hypothetical protein